MQDDMPGPRRPRTILRRVARYVVRGLAYGGASAWMCPEVVAYLFAPGQECDSDRHAGPDRVTPYAELPVRERRYLLELDAMIETRDAP
ncbi:hypothetical protein [Actinomadura fibrosa]|uniref:Uncharacterized protein n=1 Tax=Actinomadura fibrosa TaxID=111802 RepID=A0ABW2XCD4_9ACTN|nr:hypothetical protein [Actinomadura fibrosa]